MTEPGTSMPQQPTIDEALDAFLADQRERLADSTYARYHDVIDLLRIALNSYGHLTLDTKELKAWQAAYDTGDEDAFTRMFEAAYIIDGYGELLDYFLVRKIVASKQLFRDASTVTKRLARWLGAHGHITADEADIAAAHAAEAADNWRLIEEYDDFW